MAIKNYYNGKNAVGTVLTDLVGGHNGTLEGAVLPTINPNGYLTFVGGNGATAGDWNRVVFTRSDFEWNITTPFSIIIRFRSVKSDAVIHTLFAIRDGTATPNSLRNSIPASTTVSYMVMYGDSSTLKKNVNFSNYTAGNWCNNTIIYDGADVLTCFKNGYPAGLVTNDTLAGNFYSANSKANLGACYKYSVLNYVDDLSGDISELINFNHALSNAEAKNYNTYFKGMF